MFTRLVSLATVLWTLSLSALGVAYGAEEEKHAFLGIMPGEVTSDLAAEYGVKSGQGVIIEDVTSDSPADKAGLRDNDVIISVGKEAVTGPEEFRNQIGAMKPGDKVDLMYVRGGKEHTVSVELASRENRVFGFMGMGDEEMKPPEPPKAPRPMRIWKERREKERGSEMEKTAFAGIIAQDLSEGLKSYFKVDEGALISEVVEDSPADKGGLKAGDVIVRIGDQDIEDEGDVRSAIRDHKPGDKVDFVVVRDGQQKTINVTLGEQAMPDLGDNIMEWDIPELHSLKGMHFDGLDKEQMQELEQKLKDMKIEIEGLDPMDIRIEKLPGDHRVRIEKHMIGPVRYEDYNWQRSLREVKSQLKREFTQLRDSFAVLKSQLVAWGNELMGRTA